ncbi:MAG: hypothetical protein GX072_03115 [Lysinibacillus sp.]|nr:hypothetical protein [Lysinibacillus sp.]
MLQQAIKEGVLFFEKRKKEKVQHVSSMLDRISILLKEGYIFSDALMMLMPYHVKDVEGWKKRIQQQFSSGSSVVDILESFSIPKHLLIMVQIAEEKGDLSETLKYVAKQMKLTEDMKKRFVKLLVYPSFLAIILTVIFVLFRTYFLPNFQQVVSSNESFESLDLSTILLHLPDALLFFFFIVITIFTSFLYWLNKQEIEIQIKMLTLLPIINYIYKLNVTRQFSRLLGNLLVAGFSLQQALTILEKQNHSRHVSYITTMLKNRVIYGDALSDAVHIIQLFLPNFPDFVKHGEKSGYLGREILIYSDLLDERIESILKICLASVQPFFFIIIALCILAAYISMLLPMYDLINIM